MTQSFVDLKKKVRACTLCAPHLPLGPRPVFQLNPSAKVLIVGQAPGRRVHETGIAFNDPSGDRLRAWMGISREQFYNSKQVAILAMGFCYPGTGRSGDLPPRPECARRWRAKILERLPHIKLILAIGKYAQDWHLADRKKENLTQTVKAWREYAPEVIPLPHPSPRNNLWFKKNPWFEKDLVPELRKRIQQLVK